MPAIRVKCKVKSYKNITPTVFETAFETDLPVEFKAGQFVSVIIPGAGPNGRDLRRAYSIASAPEVRPVELCIKLVEGGPGTNYLNKLREGDEFTGLAPYGDFVYETPQDRTPVFIATGTGIAPFRSMVLSQEFKAASPKASYLLLGVRTEDEVLYEQEMAKIPGLTWVPAVSRPSAQWKGYVGRVTDYLRSLGQEFDWSRADFYLCGNGDMIKEVKAILEEKGVLKEHVFQEKYY